MSEEIRLMQAQIDQLQSANVQLVEQLRVLMEIVQEVNPALAAENLQQAADNQTLIDKWARGGYDPM